MLELGVGTAKRAIFPHLERILRWHDETMAPPNEGRELGVAPTCMNEFETIIKCRMLPLENGAMHRYETVFLDQFLAALVGQFWEGRSGAMNHKRQQRAMAWVQVSLHQTWFRSSRGGLAVSFKKAPSTAHKRNLGIEK